MKIPVTTPGWSNSGRCVVPAGERDALLYVGSDTRLVAHGVPCSQAATSVQAMLEEGVLGRSAHVTFHTGGFRWSCVRRNVMDKDAGPLFPTTCTSGKARITFVLEP